MVRKLSSEQCDTATKDTETESDHNIKQIRTFKSPTQATWVAMPCYLVWNPVNRGPENIGLTVFRLFLILTTNYHFEKIFSRRNSGASMWMASKSTTWGFEKIQWFRQGNCLQVLAYKKWVRLSHWPFPCNSCYYASYSWFLENTKTATQQTSVLEISVNRVTVIGGICILCTDKFMEIVRGL